jgi:acetyltransferase-like isoleucine patch superfamily enzyme
VRGCVKTILRRVRDSILNLFLRSYLTDHIEADFLQPDSPLETYLRHFLTYRYLVFGDPKRLQISKTCDLNNATLNTVSGNIVIEDFVFFGHNVSILTGTHDYNKFNRERMEAIPHEGRDIVIRRGAWIASNATVLGPCCIGEHAVVAAGALVTSDVPSYAIAAGIPARVIRSITPQDLR